MMRKYLVQLLAFFVVIFLQVLVFDNIQVSGYVNPYIYVLFLLLLPFETPNWLLLLMAFLLGLFIDFLSSTPGLHTVATLVMAFVRPYLLIYIAPRNGYEEGLLPRVSHYGLAWFTRYAVLMILIHHLFLFYVEVLTFENFFYTLLRVVLSTVFSSLFVILSQFLIFRK